MKDYHVQYLKRNFTCEICEKNIIEETCEEVGPQMSDLCGDCYGICYNHHINEKIKGGILLKNRKKLMWTTELNIAIDNYKKITPKINTLKSGAICDDCLRNPIVKKLIKYIPLEEL